MRVIVQQSIEFQLQNMSNPLNNNQSPLLISSQVLLNKRKQSLQLNVNTQKKDIFKQKDKDYVRYRQELQQRRLTQSDIDLSAIQRKQSQISEQPNKYSLHQHILSPEINLKKIPSLNKNNSDKTQQDKNGKKSQPVNNRYIINKNNNRIYAEQSEQYHTQFQQQKRQSSNLEQINWHQIWLFVKLIFFSYQFNLVQYLKDIDLDNTQKVLQLLQISPGYKPIQYIYTFYMLKYNIYVGLLAALLYPLPYSIMFLNITINLQVPFVAIFMLAGMRSGAIALLLKYCLHFPKHVFHWIVLLFTILIGLILPNNYIFILLFAISIFLSFYLHQSQQSQITSNHSPPQTNSQNNPQTQSLIFAANVNEQEIYKQYKIIDNLPQTYANLSMIVLGYVLLFVWVLQRYFDDKQLILFGQMFPISLLMNSKEMLAFFPNIYQQIIGTSTLTWNTLIALSFLFPGPYSKAFMFFIDHRQIFHVLIAYLCLYLPPILLANIYISYRHYFYTQTYYNIRQSMQSVGNGIVFCLVLFMLKYEMCFFNSICYSAVVIVVVAKLYKVRELFAITLGIFLISLRTIILNTNKNISFQTQACIEDIVNSTLTSG